MRPLAVLLMLAITSVVAAQKEGDPVLVAENWKMTYGAKNWGLSVKSVKSNGPGGFTLVLGVEKDLTASELKELKEAFPFRSGGKGAPVSSGVAFLFFDKDNVVLYKATGAAIGSTSEVTGVKGDAFRVELIGGAVQQVAKVELRSTKEPAATPPAETK